MLRKVSSSERGAELEGDVELVEVELLAPSLGVCLQFLNNALLLRNFVVQPQNNVQILFVLFSKFSHICNGVIFVCYCKVSHQFIPSSFRHLRTELLICARQDLILELRSHLGKLFLQLLILGL